MSQSDHETQESLTDALARVGIVVTAEGKARARHRLAEAEVGWTPQRYEDERAKLALMGAG